LICRSSESLSHQILIFETIFLSFSHSITQKFIHLYSVDLKQHFTLFFHKIIKKILAEPQQYTSTTSATDTELSEASAILITEDGSRSELIQQH